MNPESRRVLVRVSLLLLLTTAGFVLAEQPVRSFETATTVDLLHALGVHGVTRVLPTAISVRARSGDVYDAVLSPSCSSLASLLALGGLATLRPPGPRPRVALAVGGAMAVVFAGNIARVAASVGVGVVAGRSSLVLFHDWVGSLFGFAYTLGGFLLMLWFLLPRDGVPLAELCRIPDPGGIPGGEAAG